MTGWRWIEFFLQINASNRSHRTTPILEPATLQHSKQAYNWISFHEIGETALDRGPSSCTAEGTLLWASLWCLSSSPSWAQWRKFMSDVCILDVVPLVTTHTYVWNTHCHGPKTWTYRLTGDLLWVCVWVCILYLSRVESCSSTTRRGLHPVGHNPFVP